MTRANVRYILGMALAGLLGGASVCVLGNFSTGGPDLDFTGLAILFMVAPLSAAAAGGVIAAVDELGSKPGVFPTGSLLAAAVAAMACVFAEFALLSAAEEVPNRAIASALSQALPCVGMGAAAALGVVAARWFYAPPPRYGRAILLGGCLGSAVGGLVFSAGCALFAADIHSTWTQFFMLGVTGLGVGGGIGTARVLCAPFHKRP